MSGVARITPLAWHNLVHNWVRSGVAIAGVTFAIVLMFMQLGFLEAVKIAATLSCDALDFDLCLRSSDYHHFSDARLFPLLRLQQAKGVSGVQDVTPVMTGIFSWRNPFTGAQRAVLAQGVEPSDHVFLDATQSSLARLATPQSLLVDTISRRDFGPANGRRFGEQDEGRHVEINGHRFRIAGGYTCGAGLAAGGGIVLSRRDFRRSVPNLPANQISLGLIRLTPGEDPETVAQRIGELLPGDVEVKTRWEVQTGEVNYWVWDTNYGMIFYSGVVMALIVGTAIVYQVLVSDVASLLPEYATLKAMGYGNPFIARVVLQQSVLLALVSFGIGIVLSQMLYVVTAAGAGIPVRMTSANVLFVLAASLLMCVLSGMGAVRKAFGADPAELFR
jgi:putative ABC transport system permease protein